MSKCEPLWEYIAEKNENENVITFNKIENILGLPIDQRQHFSNKITI